MYGTSSVPVLAKLENPKVAFLRDGHFACTGLANRVGLRYITVSKFDIAKPTQAGVSYANLVGIGIADFPPNFLGAL